MGFGISLLVVFPEKAVSLTTPPPEFPVLVADPNITDRLYDEWRMVRKKVNSDYCSCVDTARALSGINVGPIGYAKNHPINSNTPNVGAIIVTSESYYGHLGVVIAINGDTLTIQEGNYFKCQLSSRKISTNYDKIIGYYH